MSIRTKHVTPAGNDVPRHIAIIMDGNGRWAKRRLMPRVAGHRKGVEALRGVSFSVGERECVGLIGPNGSGKTTIFNMITGLYIPTSGDIQFNGETLIGKPAHEIARRGVARTFQNLQLFGELSALDNVMVALKDVYRSPLPLVLLGLARAEEKRARAAALALLFGDPAAEAGLRSVVARNAWLFASSLMLALNIICFVNHYWAD